MNSAIAALEVAQLRAKFPALSQTVHGHPLAYLDSAATTQKPLSVIEAESRFYREDNANVHRGVHLLSQRSTELFESVRTDLADLIGANDTSSIVWTKGCTEAVNLVASSWGMSNLKPGDVILLSAMEHHANIVPWQLVAERTGAKVLPFPIDDDGNVLWTEFERLLIHHPVKLVGVKQLCNAIGTVNPIADIIQLAHFHGALVLVDGAQGLAHLGVNVSELDVDFYTMSAHKAYGPTGVGALYGKPEHLQAMVPYQGGGDMIRTVSWEKTTYADAPQRFEAGTPNIAGVVGFGESIRFLKSLQIGDHSSWARKREEDLLDLTTRALQEIPGLKIVGTGRKKAAIISFVMDQAHPHDIGTILDREGVAIRTGHHCCMPLMKRLGLPGTARASLAVYSSEQDIEQLVTGVRKVSEVFA